MSAALLGRLRASKPLFAARNPRFRFGGGARGDWSAALLWAAEGEQTFVCRPKPALPL